MLVVADTSPICYLLLIEEIDILPRLYKQVLIPQIVQQELAHERSPQKVRSWIEQPPRWLMIQSIDVLPHSSLDNLDPGEQAAITLAQFYNADLLIIDDLLGRQVALSYQIQVTGLLGVLDEAAKQRLIDFPTVIARLQQTTFRASPKLIQLLLQQYFQNNSS